MSTRDTHRLSNGASANLSRRNSLSFSADKGGPNVLSTGISFTGSATVSDSNNGLATFGVGEVIEVRGAASNSREFLVTASAAGELTVAPAVVTSESAGASMRIIGG